MANGIVPARPQHIVRFFWSAGSFEPKVYKKLRAFVRDGEPSVSPLDGQRFAMGDGHSSAFTSLILTALRARKSRVGCEKYVAASVVLSIFRVRGGGRERSDI